MSAPAIRRYRVPRGPLAEFVELLWLYDGFVVPHAAERLLPMPTTELVIDLRGARTASRAATLAGPQSSYWVLNTAEERSVIGVHFKVGGGFPFFGMPAGELHNVRTSLDVLWGTRAGLLVEQVLGAPSADAKFDVLESALLQAGGRLERHPAVSFAARELSASPPTHGIAAVSEAVGMCQRRFVDRFRNEVGMTPKLFARVQRFQAVIRTVHGPSEVNWAAVAADCGYFDQAHFIHDFRAFSGFTPEQYCRLKSEHRNHVPLPA